MMSRLLFIASLLLLAAVDLRAAEPEYTRKIELPPLKLSFTAMQSVLDKTANLLAAANVSPARSKEFYFRETLTLQAGPDEIEIQGHSFPANAHVPKAAYELKYSYSWTDAPVSKVELDFDDFSRRVTVSGTAADQVDAISAALEHDLSQYSSFGGTMFREVGGMLAFAIFCLSLVMGGSYCIAERQWRALGMPIFAIIGLVLLFALPFADILAGFAIYQGESSLIVRYEPQIAFAGLILTIAGILLSFFIPQWLEAGRKESTAKKES
jgi:hypothetical protein